MRSKTSFFDRTIFFNAIKRFWPIWFAYGLCWVIIMPISLWSDLSRAVYAYRPDEALLSAVTYMPLTCGLDIGLIVSAIFGIASAMAVFSYMYFPKSAGAMASLPIRREGMFISLALAGLLPMLVINLFIFLICIIVEAAFAVTAVVWLAKWLAIVSMMDLFFFGFACLCAQLTGNIIILPLVYAVLNVAIFTLEYLTRLVLGVFVYGFTSNSFILEFLSPIIAVIDNCYIEPVQKYSTELEYFITTGYIFHGWGWLIAYAVAGLALIAFALILYKRRRMESAGDVVAIRCLKPVFKVCMAVGCALCFALLIYSIVFSYANCTFKYALVFAVLLLIGCLIGYFAAQMLVQKSFRVFSSKKNWLGAAVIYAAIALVFFSCELNLFGYETRLPAYEDIESVTFGSYSEAIKLVEEENIATSLAIHESIINNKEAHDKGNRFVLAQFCYTLKNGKTMVREYHLSALMDSSPDDWSDFQDLLNTPEAVTRRKELIFPLTEENISYASVSYNYVNDAGEVISESLRLTNEEANELYYTCIVPDISEQKLGRVWLVTGEDYMNSVYDCHISIDVMEQDHDGKRLYEYFYTYPTVYSGRTNDWLIEHGIILETQAVTSDHLYSTEYAVGSSTIVTCRG